MKNVYNEDIDELYKKYKTSRDGLSEVEAKKRLEKYGENKLAEQKKKSNLVLFLGQFNDFMIILLIAASIFSAVISYVRHESFVDSIIKIVKEKNPGVNIIAIDDDASASEINQQNRIKLLLANATKDL